MNGDDDDVRHWDTNGKKLLFGSSDHGREGAFRCGDDAMIRFHGEEHRIPVSQFLRLPGDHNFQNALAAICATFPIGVENESICHGLQHFDGLPHRLQFVAEIDHRSYYNDSIATTPESVEMALNAFAGPIVILAGGYDKQLDLSPLAAAIARRAKAAALIGETGPKLEELISQVDDPRHVAKETFDSLETAFAWAVARSEEDDVVLLSPGCASYDWFENFEERGDRFVQLVNGLR